MHKAISKTHVLLSDLMRPHAAFSSYIHRGPTSSALFNREAMHLVYITNERSDAHQLNYQ